MEFRVDWRVFARPRLEELILRAPGWRVDGGLELDADWDRIKPRMQACRRRRRRRSVAAHQQPLAQEAR